MDKVTYSQLGKNGRCANQILQLCVTIAHALDTNREFIFPHWEYSRWMEKELPEGEIEVQTKYTFPFHYEAIPHMRGSTDLFGHGQSYKYFQHRWKEIKPYLTLKEEYREYIYKKYRRYLERNTCALHVRRTDYCRPENIEYHGLMGLDYYEKAATALYGNNLKDVLFIICSDDLGWCKENLKFPNMLFVEEEENIIDLNLMAQCNDFIIPNSSFSLCPAYFKTMNRWGAAPEPRVVAPKEWFQPKANLNYKDVYMPNWIQLNIKNNGNSSPT